MPSEPTTESSSSMLGQEKSTQSASQSINRREARRNSAPRVAIIGAGPAGLEAALYARSLNMDVMVFERENSVAPDVRSWSHLSMFSPWGENRTPLGELALLKYSKALDDRLVFPAPTIYPTGSEFIRTYLAPIAKTFGSNIHLETRVVAIGRTYLFPDSYAFAPERRETYRFRILTRSPLEERLFTADYVIDASGRSHTPNWMGPGGMPALGEMGSERYIYRHVPDVLGRDSIHFRGKSVLLVGDGASAATTASMLAEIQKSDPNTIVRWATRRPAELPVNVIASDPYPPRELAVKKANLLAAASHPGFEHLPLTQVEAVQHSLADGRFQVTLQVDRVTRRIAFDAVIANVGSRPDSQTFERVLHQQEPGYFSIGAKAAAQQKSEFFLSSCRQQIREVFGKIKNDPDLDLYSQASSGEVSSDLTSPTVAALAG